MANESKYVKGAKKNQKKLLNFKVDGKMYIEKCLNVWHKDFKKKGLIRRGKLTRVFQQGDFFSFLSIPKFKIDGAPSHCTNEVMEWLDRNWSLCRVVSRWTKKYEREFRKRPFLHWPAKSPDLSVLGGSKLKGLIGTHFPGLIENPLFSYLNFFSRLLYLERVKKKCAQLRQGKLV